MFPIPDTKKIQFCEFSYFRFQIFRSPLAQINVLQLNVTFIFLLNIVFLSTKEFSTTNKTENAMLPDSGDQNNQPVWYSGHGNLDNR